MRFGASEVAHYAQKQAQHLASGAGRPVGSTADLFPKLVAMQRVCTSQAFAVLAAHAQTVLVPSRLDCKMQSPGSEHLTAKLIENRSKFLLSHLGASPCPLIFAPEGRNAPVLSPALTVEKLDEGGIDLAFPVQLGAMGNGYVVFFDLRNAISNDLLIELHRKSLMVMRESLRLAFGVISATDMLNEREIECLQMVGNGMKSEAIGEQLKLSVHTVNAYLGSATTKLDAVNRIQAIAKAIRLGIIA